VVKKFGELTSVSRFVRNEQASTKYYYCIQIMVGGGESKCVFCMQDPIVFDDIDKLRVMVKLS